MKWVKQTKSNLPPYGTDALINHKDGTKEFGTIELAERTKNGWRVPGGDVCLDDVNYFAIITFPPEN